MPWPTVKTWIGDAPTAADAAGKVVVHWFCTAKVPACRDDLARIVTMREAGKIYVIGYIAGSRRDAQKLDPVRGELGAGALAYGKPIAKVLGQLGLGAGPAAIVVNVDGNVALIANAVDPDTLDKRDRKVAELAAAVREFTITKSGPTSTKVGDSFKLSLTVELSPWLSFSQKVPTRAVLTLPPNVTCDKSALDRNDLQTRGRTMSGSVNCRGTKPGSYEARADLRFGYDNPNQSTGVGTDGVGWKFLVEP